MNPADLAQPLGSKLPPRLRVAALAVTLLGIIAAGVVWVRLVLDNHVLVGEPPGETLRETSLLFMWVLVPFALGVFGLRRQASSAARSVGVLLTSGFGLLVYGGDAKSPPQGSTAGLAYVFVPLWQLMGVGLVLLITMRRGGGTGLIGR